jgi:tRNA (guanine-N7-)-methyltransferase
MGRKKLIRFARNTESYNVVEASKEIYTQIRGNWQRLHFKNQNPIVLELGCGRGEYSVGLARNFPQYNFVGVDVKGDRMYIGSQQAQHEGLENVAFLRCQIQHLTKFFAEEEVREIWLTFPDPRPKNKDRRRRLTHDRFLGMYREILQLGGLFHLKTDDPTFFEYTLSQMDYKDDFQLMRYTRDLYTQPDLLRAHFGVQTHYEKIWTEKGRTIKYLKAYVRK